MIFLYNLNYFFLNTNSFPYLSSGKIAHYYINYIDFGFVKRGLAGTVLKGIGGTTSLGLIRFSAFMIGVITCLIASFNIGRIRDRVENNSYYLLTALLIFNPATIPNIGYDLGRLDQLLIICTILSLYFINKKNITGLILISIVAVLIHELYLIMFFPLVLFICLYHSEIEKKGVVYLLLGVFGVAVLLFIFGNIESANVKQIAAAIPGEEFNFNNMGIVWKRTLPDNIRYTLNYVSDFHPSVLSSMIFGAVYMALVFIWLTAISRTNELDFIGYFVIILASLPIFFLAIDYSRWYSLMIINAFIYFIFSIGKRSTNTFRIPPFYAYSLGLLILTGIILGPIGIIRSFPLFDRFVTLVYTLFI